MKNLSNLIFILLGIIIYVNLGCKNEDQHPNQVRPPDEPMCSSSFRFFQEVKDSLTGKVDTAFLYIPGAFTPNKDRINDTLFMASKSMKKVTINIRDISKGNKLIRTLEWIGRQRPAIWAGNMRLDTNIVDQKIYQFVINFETTHGFKAERTHNLLVLRNTGSPNLPAKHKIPVTPHQCECAKRAIYPNQLDRERGFVLQKPIGEAINCP